MVKDKQTTQNKCLRKSDNPDDTTTDALASSVEDTDRTVSIVSRRQMLHTGITGLLFSAFSLPSYTKSPPEISPLVGRVAAQSKSWEKQYTIEKPDVDTSPFPTDSVGFFGNDVAVSSDGDTAIVAAKGWDAPFGFGNSVGSVFLYTRDPDADWVWNKRKRFRGNHKKDLFGKEIAVGGPQSSPQKVLVVGAPYDRTANVPDDPDNTGAGAVYIYLGFGDTYDQQQKLTGDPPEYEGFFGMSVAISKTGDTIVVGESGDDPIPEEADESHGSVYVYTLNGAQWDRQTKLLGQKDDYEENSFGVSVAISNDGNTIVVSDTVADEVNSEATGAAYIYTRSSDGSWSRTATLIPTDVEEGDRFGGSVHISGDGETVFVTETLDDNSTAEGAGSVYAFNDTGSGWVQQAKLRAGNGDEFDQFGTDVSLTDDGNKALISANKDDGSAGEKEGSVYIFERDSSGWDKQQKFPNSDKRAGERFGTAVAITGDAETSIISSLPPGGVLPVKSYIFDKTQDSSNDEQTELIPEVSPGTIPAGTETEVEVITGVAGATVEIPDLLKKDKTNSNGRITFSITEEQTGEYLVFANADGYDEGRNTLTVAESVEDPPDASVNIKSPELTNEPIDGTTSTHTLEFTVENVSADGETDPISITLPEEVNIEGGSVEEVRITNGEYPFDSSVNDNTVTLDVDPDTSESAVDLNIEVDMNLLTDEST